MGLLDDDIIIDPLPSLITRYLIDHTKYINTKYIIGGGVIGVKKYYKCVNYLNPKMIQIDYDDQPDTWYLMKRYTDDNVYITKWIEGQCRYQLDMHVLKHSGEKHYTLITLKDILDEFA